MTGVTAYASQCSQMQVYKCKYWKGTRLFVYIMSYSKHHVAELSKIIRAKYNDLKKMEADRKENLEHLFKPVTEPLQKIAEQTLNEPDSSVNENYFEKYKSGSDTAYGPRYEFSAWKLGNKNVKFGNNDITIDDSVFKITPGIYELLFSKIPKNFTSEDLDTYKQLLELSNVHLDSKGRLRHQACKEKFENIIKPLFGKTRSLKKKSDKKPTNNVKSLPVDEEEEELNKKLNKSQWLPIKGEEESNIELRKWLPIDEEDDHSRAVNIIYWVDPNDLVDRLRSLTPEDEEFHIIIEELRNEGIIE